MAAGNHGGPAPCKRIVAAGCEKGRPRRDGPAIAAIAVDQPNSALQISSMTSADIHASVVGTDHSSIWCFAFFTPSMRLITQK